MQQTRASSATMPEMFLQMALLRNREATVCCTDADFPNVHHPIKGERRRL
jgi:hypothetical protein